MTVRRNSHGLSFCTPNFERTRGCAVRFVGLFDVTVCLELLPLTA